MIYGAVLLLYLVKITGLREKFTLGSIPEAQMHFGVDSKECIIGSIPNDRRYVTLRLPPCCSHGFRCSYLSNLSPRFTQPFDSPKWISASPGCKPPEQSQEFNPITRFPALAHEAFTDTDASGHPCNQQYL